MKRCSGVELVRQEAMRLLEAGEITGWEALWLSVCPPARAVEGDRAKGWAPEIRDECLRLYAEGGLSCPEVARRVGVPMATAKAWLWPEDRESRRVRTARARARAGAVAASESAYRVPA